MAAVPAGARPGRSAAEGSAAGGLVGANLVGLGSDLVDLDRFRLVLARTPAITERLFTEREQAYARARHDPTERYGGRFAAKEATMKALGVGLGQVRFRDLEVVRLDSGAPVLALHGPAAELAAAQGIVDWRVTISHTDHLAQALVVALGVPDMIPVVTPEEMAAVDRAAPEPTEVLIGRAGAAVAGAARTLLGGAYGRRVVVVAGKGNNGNDGREAARRLARRGVRVEVVPAGSLDRLPPCDLVIDAAYGTGFRGSYRWPSPSPPTRTGSTGRSAEPTPVLAVDIPSGVDGLTGQADVEVGRAVMTVTFAALKPGLLFEPGAGRAGDVAVADIGLDVGDPRTHLLEEADVAAWWPTRPAASHKWRSAVWVVAGSPGMAGAAALVSGGAQRAGAGYVRVSSPGGLAGPGLGVEVVQVELPAQDWASTVRDGLDRFRALVLGNGLGTDEATQAQIRALLAAPDRLGLPTVIDADGLTALGADAADFVGPDTVVTPHDGEFARLAGGPPGPDRLAAARGLADQLGCVVVLKGGPTVVAAPGGEAVVVASGDARLATAGTGDVLAGIIAALAARGLDPWRAAAAGAFLHGQAAALGWADGLVAGDLLDQLPRAIDRLTRPSTA